MKHFNIEARLIGHSFVDDIYSPYYTEVPCEMSISASVFAETEERAKEMIAEYDYERDRRNPWVFAVDEDPVFRLISSEEAEDGGEEIEVEYIKISDQYPYGT